MGGEAMNTLVSEWLRTLRQERGLRQADIDRRTAALHARITQATVSRLETGRQHPTDLRAAQVAALCAVLDITPQTWQQHVGRPVPPALEDDA